MPFPSTTQDRIIKFLKADSIINVFFTATNPERDGSLIRVDIPLTRGLLGHRVLVVRQSDLSKYKNYTKLDDLRKLRIGSGLGWPDNSIFQKAGFKVVEAQYKQLWKMLQAGRFDAFQRGIQEYSIELEDRPNLNFVALPDVMVVFPFDYFFFVSKANPGPVSYTHLTLPTIYSV